MRRTAMPLFVAACVLLLAGPSAAGEKGGKTVTIVGYPDGAEWLMTRVLRRVGRAYREETGGKVRVEPRLSYREARNKVLEGKAAGMMISEKGNRFRAYASQTGGERGFSELKMNRFLPFATRVIRSEDEVLSRMRLGLATDRRAKKLRRFLSFLSTDAAKRAIRGIPDLELTPPADEPTRDTSGLKRGGPVELEEPILVYY